MQGGFHLWIPFTAPASPVRAHESCRRLQSPDIELLTSSTARLGGRKRRSRRVRHADHPWPVSRSCENLFSHQSRFHAFPFQIEPHLCAFARGKALPIAHLPLVRESLLEPLQSGNPFPFKLCYEQSHQISVLLMRALNDQPYRAPNTSPLTKGGLRGVWRCT